MARPPKDQSGTGKPHLNEGIGLERFNYDNMTGKQFAEYLDLVQGKVMDEEDPLQRRGGGLPDKKYVFEVYNVRPKMKRLYPQSRVDNTKVPDGFTLFQSKPTSITTTFLRYALLQNESLYSQIGGANNNPIYYYLLQIPTPSKD